MPSHLQQLGLLAAQSGVVGRSAGGGLSAALSMVAVAITKFNCRQCAIAALEYATRSPRVRAKVQRAPHEVPPQRDHAKVTVYSFRSLHHFKRGDKFRHSITLGRTQASDHRQLHWVRNVGAVPGEQHVHAMKRRTGNVAAHPIRLVWVARRPESGIGPTQGWRGQWATVELAASCQCELARQRHPLDWLPQQRRGK